MELARPVCLAEIQLDVGESKMRLMVGLAALGTAARWPRHVPTVRGRHLQYEGREAMTDAPALSDDELRVLRWHTRRSGCWKMDGRTLDGKIQTSLFNRGYLSSPRYDQFQITDAGRAALAWTEEKAMAEPSKEAMEAALVVVTDAGIERDLSDVHEDDSQGREDGRGQIALAIHHEGMHRDGMYTGRGDAKAGKGGDAIAGKSGGGCGSLSNDLIASPMSPQMLPDRAKEGC